ncbi:hypothetical protein ACFUOZ_04680 [Paenarthrobacter sp. NPDC057355]|uniref:hypothetical protein n=1 Tax=Paenarthrobacter sp. NPDC057355 TaxID=3346105 RepID=UPI003624B365
MTTFTATPDTATGSVLLEITQTAAVTRVVRTDANGIADVRFADGQLPSASTGTTIVSDYEAAHGFVSYLVYTSAGTVSGSTTLVLANPWLTVPIMPQYSETVQTVTQYSSNRATNNTVHRPIGRADSLVVMGKLGDRTGSLEIFCNDYSTTRKLERVFERGEIVMLRQRVEGLDQYFTVTDIPVAPYAVNGEKGTQWAMTINYVEVRRPLGDLAGNLGWTFDALAAAYPSFDAVAAAYVDFDALTLGEAIA